MGGIRQKTGEMLGLKMEAQLRELCNKKAILRGAGWRLCFTMLKQMTGPL